MRPDDLDQLWSIAERLEDLADRNGYPSDLLRLASEARCTFACYRDDYWQNQADRQPDGHRHGYREGGQR